MNKKKSITRRELIRKSAMAAAGSTLLMNLPAKAFPKAKTESTVILIRRKEVLRSDGKINPAVLEEMVDEAVVRLTGAGTPSEAWTGLFGPEDVVGIKTNSWSRLPTPPELEQILKKRVISTGVPEKSISINDRGVMTDPVFLKATALINTRPLRTHAWAGLGTLLKNYITFTDNKPSFHPDSCADLAKLWEFPQVKGKTRLNILVMLTPLFHGVGPHHFNRKYVWNYGGLLVGFDPVAVDATGAEIIRARRREYFGKDVPINPPPKHILLADQRYHLGTADLTRIKLMKVGWQEGILI